ncbi:MAG: hypothetical protein HZC40_12830 [Chloroflexi bacterium]|nr:hypothetical protein [Chloroflexota bacterium]
MVQPPTPARNAPSIQVQGDVHGSIVSGDGNLVVNTNNGTIYFTAPKPQVSKRNVVPPPPRAPLNFLDRTDQVSQTSNALRANEPVALYGPDGIGKTALLKQVAAHLPRDQYPDGFVLLNGARETGVPQSLDDLAQTAFDALFESNPPLKVTTTTARTYLGNVRACFLLDHLALAPDALDQIPDLFSSGGILYAGLQPPRGQTAQPITLSGLPRADAITLFVQAAQIAPTPADQSMLNQVCNLLDDLPLAIVTLARWVNVKRVPLANAVRALEAQSANGIARALGAVIASLANTTRIMFGLAASIHGAVIDRAALISASGMDAATAGAAVDELLALGLIQAHSPEVGMHPALKDWARQSVPANAQRVTRLNEIILREAQRHARDVNYLRGQLGNLFGGLMASAEAGNVQQVGAFARVLMPVLVLSGSWDVWQRVFQRVLESATQSADRALQGWALHELGTRALALKDLTTARELLTQALLIRQSIGDQVGAAYTQHNLNFLIPPPPPQEPSPKSPAPVSPVALVAIIVGGVGMLILAAIVLAIIFFPPPRPAPREEVVIIVPGATPTTLPPSATPRSSPTLIPSGTPSLLPTVTPSSVPSASSTPSATRTPSQTASVTPSITPSITPDLPPSAPLLVSPVNDKVEPCSASPTTILLRWLPAASASGIAYYEWTVERAVRGIYSPFYEDTIDSASVFMILACGYSYRWRVRAVDLNQNIGAWSVDGQFVIAGEPTPVPSITPDRAGPAAPGLIAPVGDDKRACALITFSWNAVSDPSGIAFYEWAVEQWSNGTYNGYTGGTPSGNSTSTTHSIACGKWYRWRIRAWDNRRNQGAWSVWGQFFVEADLPPPVPSVIGPKSNDHIPLSAADLVLRWNPSAANDLARYEWELERATGMNAPFNRSNNGATTNTSASLPKPGCPFYYRWHVRAVDQANHASGWSPYAYFTIDCPGPR